MARFLLTLAYDGSDFSGWQLQMSERTVQSVVEAGLAEILDSPVRIHGAGRTDAGVHALGQRAHFDISEDRGHIPFDRALNSVLPPDVRVLACRRVPDDFHARFQALDKTYSYTLQTGPVALPQRRRYAWRTGPLDIEALDRAARELTGELDFAAFMNTGTEVSSTVRRVTAIERAPGPFAGEEVVRVTADGFLKQMVRNMVGCLVAAARGKVSPQTIRSIQDEGDRSLAPATAPAHGLCLERVRYLDGIDGQDILESTPGGDGRQA